MSREETSAAFLGRRKWLLLLALLVLLAQQVAACDAFRSAEHHLSLVEGQLSAGEPEVALAHLERRGLIATVEGRVLALRALVELDRVMEAVELLAEGEGAVPAELQVTVCEAGLAEAVRRGDRPSQVRVVEACRELAGVPDGVEGGLSELGRFRLGVLRGELPAYRERRAHVAGGAEDRELAEALAEGYAHLGEVLERVDHRSAALRMRWELVPSEALREELLARFMAEAEAVREESPQDAITWYEHVARAGRVPGLDAPEELVEEVLAVLRPMMEEIAREGAVAMWERRRMALDVEQGIWDAEAEEFVFPPEDLEARRVRFRAWFLDRANWTYGEYAGFDLLGRMGLCRDPAEECRISLEQFASWAVQHDTLGTIEAQEE